MKSASSATFIVNPLASDESFVDLDNRARAARHGRRPGAHGFAQPMLHRPSGFVLHLQGTMKLVSANSLLAGSYEMRRLKPFAQRDFRTLETLQSIAFKSFATNPCPRLLRD
jgi:hypothetical protein